MIKTAAVHVITPLRHHYYTVVTLVLPGTNQKIVLLMKSSTSLNIECSATSASTDRCCPPPAVTAEPRVPQWLFFISALRLKKYSLLTPSRCFPESRPAEGAAPRGFRGHRASSTWLNVTCFIIHLIHFFSIIFFFAFFH